MRRGVYQMFGMGPDQLPRYCQQVATMALVPLIQSLSGGDLRNSVKDTLAEAIPVGVLSEGGAPKGVDLAGLGFNRSNRSDQVTHGLKSISRPLLQGF